MSRAFRLTVRENLRQVLRAGDEVRSHLEMLPILPPAQMGDLLGAALAERGFVVAGRRASRDQDGVLLEVDLDSLQVIARSHAEKEIALSAEGTALVFDDLGPLHQQQEAAKLRNELRKKLAGQADAETAALKTKAVDQLEAALANARRELDSAIHQATAGALKIKAGELGRIKEMTEDPQSGSLTIVVEV